MKIWTNIVCQGPIKSNAEWKDDEKCFYCNCNPKKGVRRFTLKLYTFSGANVISEKSVNCCGNCHHDKCSSSHVNEKTCDPVAKGPSFESRAFGSTDKYKGKDNFERAEGGSSGVTCTNNNNDDDEELCY